MICTKVLQKPFVMLFLNFEFLELNHKDLLSAYDCRILSEIGDKLIEILPEGKIANKYKYQWNSSTDIWATSAIVSDIRRYMDVDTQNMLYQFRSDFYKDCVDLDAEVAKYIKVFKPMVDALYENHLSKIKIISEGINA